MVCSDWVADIEQEALVLYKHHFDLCGSIRNSDCFVAGRGVHQASRRSFLQDHQMSVWNCPAVVHQMVCFRRREVQKQSVQQVHQTLRCCRLHFGRAACLHRVGQMPVVQQDLLVACSIRCGQRS